MKAAICFEFGKSLVVQEIGIDAPRAGEVRVRLAACAICHSDIHAIEGAWGGSLPAVYGHEAAGGPPPRRGAVTAQRVGVPDAGAGVAGHAR